MMHSKHAELRRLAESGDRHSQLGIARQFLYGSDGVDRDVDAAITWARRALLESTMDGAVEEDSDVSLNLFLRAVRIASADRDLVERGFKDVLDAAIAGDVDAMQFLGMEFRDGIGDGAANPHAALYWFELADLSGGVDARKMCRKMQDRIDAAERLGAQQLPTSENDECDSGDTDPRSNVAAPVRTARVRAPAEPAGTAANTAESTNQTVNGFQERRANPACSVTKAGMHRSNRVLGGLLPKKTVLPAADIELRYDGSYPTYTAGGGVNQRCYKTDGNLQVFYRRPEAVGKFVWFARCVDIYNEF